jgi:hypothetical protein
MPRSTWLGPATGIDHPHDRPCARLVVMNSMGAFGVETCMRDRAALVTAAFGGYFYYGLTAQGRAHR